VALIETYGKFHFDPVHVTKKHNKQGDWKTTALVLLNDDLTKFYAWMIERRYGIRLNQPLRGSHVSFINDRMNNAYQKDRYQEIREMYEGKEVNFFYDPDVRTNAEHWWLKVTSNDLLHLRDKIGIGRPYFGLHLTIGTVPKTETARYEHSKYIHDLLREGKTW
jgi:hypothetical protein